MTIRRSHLATTAAALGLLTALAAAAPASAGYGAAAVKNGNFERGNLSGWDAQAGAEGRGQSIAEWRVYSEGDRTLPCPPMSPECLGGATLPVPLGRYASVFVQNNPSNGALSQDFRVGKRARYLSIRAFWVNQAGGPQPNGLRGLPASTWPFTGNFDFDPASTPNQYFSIDLVKRNANPLTTSEGDILASGLAPNSATAAESAGWQTVKIPLRNLRGKQVKLRLAAVDNQSYLNVGLDSVRVVNARKPKPVTG